MKHRASLCLSFEAIHKLLNLRSDVSLIGVSVDARREAVDFILSGDRMPAASRLQDIQRVPAREVMDLDWEIYQ